jgi:hypothetical protein
MARARSSGNGWIGGKSTDLSIAGECADSGLIQAVEDLSLAPTTRNEHCRNINSKRPRKRYMIPCIGNVRDRH